VTRPSRPLVIAHRGASGYRPGNTFSAFALAVEQRADMIETDLHRSRDGVIVIRHDEELASLGGNRGIADSELAEIQGLDAGDGQKIPTLDEMLDRFGQMIPFNLEIKAGPKGAYPELEAEALAAVEGRGLLNSTLFSSFDDGVLQRLRALSSKARLAVLVSPRQPKRAIERAEAVSAEAINPGLGIADAEWIEAAHTQDLAVYVYTVNESAEMGRLLDAGVDGLFTNYPDELRRWLPLHTEV
jgi:glycerophosphoryl diester phosphodiesterase